jgi:uncharacterized membrane protein YdcZ (DUF606 family)
MPIRILLPSSPMIFTIALPLAIGCFGVLQNTVNRKIADGLGLPLALVLNNIVLLATSLLLFFALKLFGPEQLPDIFRPRPGLPPFSWYNLIPGLLGFFIIATAPWSIARVGATKVFIMVIMAQIVTSILWDYLAESTMIQPVRLIGAGLVAVGAYLAVR